MILTPVERIPDRTLKRTQKCLDDILDAFGKCDGPLARVDFDSSDYQSVETCRSAIYNAIDLRNLPYKVISRNGSVYLVKPKILCIPKED